MLCSRCRDLGVWFSFRYMWVSVMFVRVMFVFFVRVCVRVLVCCMYGSVLVGCFRVISIWLRLSNGLMSSGVCGPRDSSNCFIVVCRCVRVLG